MNTKRKVCVAIRSPMDASRVELTLGKDGYDVVPFHSAIELWEHFPRLRPRLIITDRRFKDGFSAVELCQGLRAQFMEPYVYVIVLSARNQLKDVDDLLAVGADDYIVKPYNPLQIRTRVRVALRWLLYIDVVTGAIPPQRGSSALPASKMR